MPSALTYPGVYIEEIPSGVRTISGVGTSTALFVGWAPSGPINRALRLTGFSDFERNYGSFSFDSLLAYSVRHFYDNGGSDAYVLRIGDPATMSVASCALDNLRVEATSPGDWAHVFSVRLTRRTPPNADRFSIDVIQPGANNRIVESFANLSMNPSDSRFAPAIINGRSAFIDKLIDTIPAIPATTPADGLVALGSLGLGAAGTPIGPADATFRNQLTAAFQMGGSADRIDLVNIICVPGLVDAPTITAMQQRAHERRAFLVVDSDENDTVANVAATLPARTGSYAENAGLFFPWVRAPDPLRQNAIRAFPPCGFVAGIMARTDATRGVWKAPAGTEAGLSGAAGLSIIMSDAENGQLNPLAVNCLRQFPAYGNVLWGARTMDGNNDNGSEWKYIPVRRLALFIEESLYRGTHWVVFEPNDEPLWAQIRLNIGAFMNDLFRQGAFQGRSPREAYFVKCDRETTTQNDINKGIVNIRVGFAPLKPAEFVVIQLQQIAGEIQT